MKKTQNMKYGSPYRMKCNFVISSLKSDSEETRWLINFYFRLRMENEHDKIEIKFGSLSFGW